MSETEFQPVVSEGEPELLYHYTDQNGLLGILGSDCLWATHFGFLNDSAERQEAVRIFLDTIAQRASGGKSTGVARGYQNQVLQNVLKESQEIDAYFVCFTKEDYDPGLQRNDQMMGDRLSQWRGYAQDRQGFSLGFDKSLLKSGICRSIVKPRVSACLIGCQYDDELKRGVISSFLGNLDEEIRGWNQSKEEDISQLS